MLQIVENHTLEQTMIVTKQVNNITKKYLSKLVRGF